MVIEIAFRGLYDSSYSIMFDGIINNDNSGASYIIIKIWFRLNQDQPNWSSSMILALDTNVTQMQEVLGSIPRFGLFLRFFWLIQNVYNCYIDRVIDS